MSQRADRLASDTWAVVPVKRLHHAKRRLAPVLDPVQRREFFQAMVEDVLNSVCAVSSLSGVMVVTPDPLVMSIAEAFSAEVLKEEESRGHTSAVERAATTLVKRGVSTMPMRVYLDHRQHCVHRPSGPLLFLTNPLSW